MGGRRVARNGRRRNPLYVLFMLLFVLVFVLAVTAAVLGLKLRAANKTIERLQNENKQVVTNLPEEDKTPQNDPQLTNGGTNEEHSDKPDVTKPDTKPVEKPSNTVGWLDLGGFNGVKPSSVFDEYYTYYTSDGVNMRSGPGTNHSKVALLALGTEVKAAAKQDGWTFVKASGKFGWIRSDFLVLTKPEIRQEEPAEPSSAGTETPAGQTAPQNADGQNPAHE